MTFEEWLDITGICISSIPEAREIWHAAQTAERERTIGIMLKHVGSSMRPWNECVTDAIKEINELDT